MRIRTKVWIDDEQDRVIVGQGRLRILETVDRMGSMNKAARELKMSYRALWGRIKSTEERLGTKLLTTKSGGGRGRGSTLTDEGRRLVENYKVLHETILRLADGEFEKIFGRGGKR